MVGQFLTLADKGGGGVWTPPFLADVICEQPLMHYVRGGLQFVLLMLHFVPLGAFLLHFLSLFVRFL